MKVLITTASEEEAIKLVEQLLNERLIGCGNILPPMTSIYRWKGKVERDKEVMIIMETTTQMSELAFQRLQEYHPYDVPKIYTLEADKVSEAYLSWLSLEVQRSS